MYNKTTHTISKPAGVPAVAASARRDLTGFRDKLLSLLIIFVFAQCNAGTIDDNQNKPGPGKQISPGNADLYGLVEDETGKPLKGVVVSDGYSCVVTDAEGVYRIKRDSAAKYVFYSTPSGYDLSTGKSGVREFYKKINVSPSAKMRADFKLTATQNVKRYKVIAIADPQVANSDEVNRFQHETIKDIKEHFAGSADPYYMLVLGDIVADKKELLPLMKGLLGVPNVPFFVTAGNHDKFRPSAGDIKNGEYFSSVFGPLNYSFNIGDAHFICLDNIIFSSSGYTSGFSDEQLEWMRQDLSFVPKDKMLILFYHRHTLNTNGPEMHKLLEGYSEVHIMAGHTHANSNIISSKSPLKYQHVTGAACGHWWSSTINADGTPNGYGVYEIENNTIKNWYYKAVNYPADYQIRLYRGDAVFGGPNGMFSFDMNAYQIAANVWNADEDWTIEVYEDGVKTGTMAAFKGIDAWATGYHNGILTEKGFAAPEHLYRYTLKNPDAEIKVVATDRFGNKYIQTQFTTDHSTAASY